MQHVSCEAGSEQGQTTEGLSYVSELLLPKSKINNLLVLHVSLLFDFFDFALPNEDALYMLVVTVYITSYIVLFCAQTF